MFNLSEIPVESLEGKVILITGAGHGIGACFADFAAKRGAMVIAGYLSDQELQNHANIYNIPLNVTKASDIEKVMTYISDKHGKLDCLVNNAGIIDPIGHLNTLCPDDLRAAFEVNVFGVQNMINAARPMLTASKGVVVNAGTGAATTAMEGWAAYCASKAAIRMLTQIYALEDPARQIRYHFIGIPPTDTAMQGKIRDAGLNPISKIPQKDLVNPMIPASAMAWLCSNAAIDLCEVLLDVRQEPFSSLMRL